MKNLFSHNSPFRIFVFSAIFSLFILLATAGKLGASSLSILLVLIIIEITFSFENAIINAKVLTTLNKFWQTMFLTVGIIIAIFGMRIVFPIIIVSVTSNLGWKQVLDLALNNPATYSEYLDNAYPLIAGFGGAFLTMLGLHFFLDNNKKIHWIRGLEKSLNKLSGNWMPAILTATIVFIVSQMPANTHSKETITSGAVGIVTFIFIHGLSEYFGKIQQKNNLKRGSVKISGFAGLLTFMYLELLDASFSLDGVIGAFAITDHVILIAAGLGIGAIWVRSMTVYMVRNGTLKNYIYLEHGAHYTVLVLAATMFLSELYHIPEAIAGLAGIILIVSSIYQSRRVTA